MSLMSAAYEILLISTSLIGFYVFISLIFFSRQNWLLNTILGVYALFLAFLYLLVFMKYRQWAPDLLVLIRTFLPYFYILPPLFYLYFRAIIRDQSSLKTRDLIHAIPLSLHLLYTLPVFYGLMTGSIQMAELIAKVDNQTYFYNYGFIPDRIHFILRISSLVIYLILTWRVYLSRDYRHFRYGNPEKFTSVKRWVSYLLVYANLITVTGMLLQSKIITSGGNNGLNRTDFFSVLFTLTVDFLFLYAIFHPEILFGMPRFEKSLSPLSELKSFSDKLGSAPGQTVTAPGLPDVQPGGTVEDNECRDFPSLSAGLLISGAEHELIVRIEVYVRVYRPYMQKDFNIKKVSDALQIPKHHICYLFREILNKSFVDYRTELRVQHVKNAIHHGQHKFLTFEAIGEEAGFNSRSVFFTAFKKHTGKSPGHYAQERIAPASEVGSPA